MTSLINYKISKGHTWNYSYYDSRAGLWYLGVIKALLDSIDSNKSPMNKKNNLIVDKNHWILVHCKHFGMDIPLINEFPLVYEASYILLNYRVWRCYWHLQLVNLLSFLISCVFKSLKYLMSICFAKNCCSLKYEKGKIELLSTHIVVLPFNTKDYLNFNFCMIIFFKGRMLFGK